MNEKRLQHLKVVYGIALAFIALTLLSSSFMMQYAIQRNGGDSRVINLSGRQRMLSQRLTKCVLALGHTSYEEDQTKRLREIAESFAAWKAAHLGLQFGDEQLGLPARKNSTEIRIMFAAMEPFHAAMVQALETLLAKVKDQKCDPLTINTTGEVMLRNESHFLELMDKITFEFDKEAKARIGGMQKLDRAILAVGILVLLLEFLFVFRPSISQLAVLMTSSEKSEAAAKEALARLQKIAARVPGLVYQFRLRQDGTMCLPYASDGIRELYRVSPEDIREDAAPLFSLHHPDDRAGIDASIRKSARELTPWVHEYRTLFADGTERWLSGNAIPERASDGSTLWHGFICDITSRKKAQQELYELNLNLKAQTKLAVEMAVRADLANKAKGQFLANMSHEIRTPMNGVIGMTELLLETPLDENQLQYAKIVRSSGEALLALINDILDFSKIEAGKMEIETLSFELRPVIDDFAAMMAINATKKGLKFTSSMAPGIPDFLCGDPARIRQILINLVGNAIKFTKKGELQLQTQLVSQNDNNITIRFSIKDTGIGIPADKQALLFEKFSQVDTSTTRRYGGTGLGLAISKQLAELMGGEIGVISEEGKGSEFWFTVCCKKNACGKNPPIPTSPAHGRSVSTSVDNLHPAHILLVEDNITNQEVAINILRSLGYTQVDSVPNGVKALQALKGHAYDLVIMDVQMPEMDGLEATQHIRNSDPKEMNPRIPIIALTAHALKGDHDQCSVAGMDDYLTKPVMPKALKDMLEKWLPENIIRPTAAPRAPETTRHAEPADNPVLIATDCMTGSSEMLK